MKVLHTSGDFNCPVRQTTIQELDCQRSCVGQVCVCVQSACRVMNASLCHSVNCLTCVVQ